MPPAGEEPTESAPAGVAETTDETVEPDCTPVAAGVVAASMHACAHFSAEPATSGEGVPTAGEAPTADATAGVAESTAAGTESVAPGCKPTAVIADAEDMHACMLASPGRNPGSDAPPDGVHVRASVAPTTPDREQPESTTEPDGRLAEPGLPVAAAGKSGSGVSGPTAKPPDPSSHDSTAAGACAGSEASAVGILGAATVASPAMPPPTPCVLRRSSSQDCARAASRPASKSGLTISSAT